MSWPNSAQFCIIVSGATELAAKNTAVSIDWTARAFVTQGKQSADISLEFPENTVVNWQACASLPTAGEWVRTSPDFGSIPAIIVPMRGEQPSIITAPVGDLRLRVDHGNAAFVAAGRKVWLRPHASDTSFPRYVQREINVLLTELYTIPGGKMMERLSGWKSYDSSTIGSFRAKRNISNLSSFEARIIEIERPASILGRCSVNLSSMNFEHAFFDRFVLGVGGGTTRANTLVIKSKVITTPGLKELPLRLSVHGDFSKNSDIVVKKRNPNDPDFEYFLINLDKNDETKRKALPGTSGCWS